MYLIHFFIKTCFQNYNINERLKSVRRHLVVDPRLAVSSVLKTYNIFVFMSFWWFHTIPKNGSQVINMINQSQQEIVLIKIFYFCKKTQQHRKKNSWSSSRFKTAQKHVFKAFLQTG